MAKKQFCVVVQGAVVTRVATWERACERAKAYAVEHGVCAMPMSMAQFEQRQAQRQTWAQRRNLTAQVVEGGQQAALEAKQAVLAGGFKPETLEAVKKAIAVLNSKKTYRRYDVVQKANAWLDGKYELTLKQMAWLIGEAARVEHVEECILAGAR